MRGATVKLWHWIVRRNISTHAPLAGRDVLCECNPSAIIGNFNPRAPCGARLRDAAERQGVSVFQPTRPLRGATIVVHAPSLLTNISTHAPLAGRDSLVSSHSLPFRISTHAPLAGRDDVPGPAEHDARADFNPRAPCGARPVGHFAPVSLKRFQPTRPLRGATAKVYKSLCTFLR